MSNFNIVLANLAICMESQYPELSLVIESTYAAFAQPLTKSACDCNLKVNSGLPPTEIPDSPVFDSGTYWAAFLLKDHYLFRFWDDETRKAEWCRAQFSHDFTKGTIYYASGFNPDPSHISVGYPLLELLMISLLAQGKGVIVHACGINDNGRGFLFPAPSTHGKTTMAKVWGDDAIVLNDERIVLRWKNGEYWIYGTPWSGECPVRSPSGVKLERICFLSKSESNYVSEAASTEAFFKLFGRCYLPYWDERGMNFTFDFCSQLIETVPCCNLGFKPDRSIIDFLRAMK